MPSSALGATPSSVLRGVTPSQGIMRYKDQMHPPCNSCILTVEVFLQPSNIFSQIYYHYTQPLFFKYPWGDPNYSSNF